MCLPAHAFGIRNCRSELKVICWIIETRLPGLRWCGSGTSVTPRPKNTHTLTSLEKGGKKILKNPSFLTPVWCFMCVTLFFWFCFNYRSLAPVKCHPVCTAALAGGQHGKTEAPSSFASCKQPFVDDENENICLLICLHSLKNSGTSV